MNAPVAARFAGVLATLALLGASSVAWGQIPSRNLAVTGHFNPYPPPGGTYGYASCWGYVHGDGREYAVLGAAQGTVIYNVTDPDAAYFVAMIPGLPSVWREMKSYRNWIYVVTEATSGSSVTPGVQIIRMTDPENPVLAATYAVNFNHSHTVSVDTARAVLICSGTRMNTTATGMRFLSLADPEAPVQIGWWPGGTLPVSTANYVHDCVPVGNRLYASSVYVGTQRILDFTNPAAPTAIASFTYPGAFYSHNSWPDASGDYLYVTDEQNGQTLRTIDIRNPASPVVVNEWTPNPQAIVHNAHVLGDELWLASYTEGVRVLDISDPAHPAEYGYADTYPGASGGFNGVWGVYPYFPSGTVIASDMNSGLWVLRPNRDYGLVRVEVQGGAGAEVFLVTQGDSTVTGADGVATFAPNPGSHLVRVRKFGYLDAEAMVNVSVGSRDTIVVDLVAKPIATYGGIVLDAATLLPLSEAEVTLSWTPLHAHTGADGAFDLGSIPADDYRVEVRRPGYMPRLAQLTLGPGANGNDFALAPVATYDPLASASGWTVGAPGDNAVSGVWTNVEPLGTYIGAPGPAGGAGAARARPPSALWSRGALEGSGLGAVDPASIKPGAGMLHEGHEGAGNAGQVQPDRDRSPAPDSTCFVTGQGTNPTNIAEADVDGPNGTPGWTTLTSPVYDVSGMQDPVIGFWSWFYTEFGSPDDWLAISISNNGGASWLPVDTLRGLRNHWRETSLRVQDLLPPTSQMRLRFVAADMGVGSVVEAAIDDISVYDAALAPVDAPRAAPAARLAFRAPRPNPSRGAVSLSLDLPRAGRVDVDVLDVTGRVVRTLRSGEAPAGPLPLAWNGFDRAGRAAPAGVYFARARLGAERATTRMLIIR